jgi:hypothetical protein
MVSIRHPLLALRMLWRLCSRPGNWTLFRVGSWTGPHLTSRVCRIQGGMRLFGIIGSTLICRPGQLVARGGFSFVGPVRFAGPVRDSGCGRLYTCLLVKAMLGIEVHGRCRRPATWPVRSAGGWCAGRYGALRGVDRPHLVVAESLRVAAVGVLDAEYGLGEDADRDGYCECVRFFNTSGPCDPGVHYMLPPEPRLPGARDLVDQGQYFVVHAPRQTGKTTTLAALAQDIAADGRRVALLFSCERARIYSDDVGAAGRAILEAIAEEARFQEIPADCMPPDPWPGAPPDSVLSAGLRAWAESCPRPLVLFFDEIDSLSGLPLLSVLSQLRDGFRSRPRGFPAAVALCGLRDIRDYRVAGGQDPERRSTSSPFNIKVESLRMGDFTRAQVAELYGQRTAETGQEFTAEAVTCAFEYSQGQPWLVNSLAREITLKMGVKPPEPVTAAHVDEAKERLILDRATHLDYLADRLAEPRVKRVMEPLLAGEFVTEDPTYNDDMSYVRDLGLIRQGRPIAIANPIYNEVIGRVLTERAADQISVTPASFLLPDGRLDVRKLLAEFAAFWKQNGEILVRGEAYHEVAPQLVFMAYLQRVVNGGGHVAREYGIGRGRIDLLITKPYTGLDGKRAAQREVIELKVRRQKEGNPLEPALVQLDEYLSRLDLDTGTLIVFDRRPSVIRKQPGPEFSRHRTPDGREITLLTT